MLNGGPAGRGRGERGSGSAIGAAVMFPILVLVYVLLHMLTDSAHIEQGLQAAANRAARTASLCCYATGAAAGAAEASLVAAEDANAFNQILCNNDLAGDSSTVFVDVDGHEVASGPDDPVPPGGTVYVFVVCHVPPRALGGFGVPGLEGVRRTVGVAAVDPYRFRIGA